MHNYNKDYNKKSEKPAVDEVVEETVVETTEEVVETVDVLEEETLETAETVYGVVCNCKKLNIRKTPNVNSVLNVLCVIAENTKVIVDPASIDADGDWLNVCTEAGVAGYCKKEFIRIET